VHEKVQQRHTATADSLSPTDTASNWAANEWPLRARVGVSHLPLKMVAELGEQVAKWPSGREGASFASFAVSSCACVCLSLVGQQLA